MVELKEKLETYIEKLRKEKRGIEEVLRDIRDTLRPEDVPTWRRVELEKKETFLDSRLFLLIQTITDLSKIVNE